MARKSLGKVPRIQLPEPHVVAQDRQRVATPHLLETPLASGAAALGLQPRPSTTGTPLPSMRSSGQEAPRQHLIGRASRSSKIYSASQRLGGVLAAPGPQPGTPKTPRKPGSSVGLDRTRSSSRCGTSSMGEDCKSSHDIDREMERLFQETEKAAIQELVAHPTYLQVPVSNWSDRPGSSRSTRVDGVEGLLGSSHHEGAADIALRRLTEWSGGALDNDKEGAEEDSDKMQQSYTADAERKSSSEVFQNRLSRVRTKLEAVQRQFSQSSAAQGLPDLMQQTAPARTREPSAAVGRPAV